MTKPVVTDMEKYHESDTIFIVHKSLILMAKLFFEVRNFYTTIFFLFIVHSMVAQLVVVVKDSVDIQTKSALMAPILFQATDWSNVLQTEHPGETGTAYWRTLQFDGLRIRMVEYSENYKANHWCSVGHLVY